jgi:hypothetical protein
MGHHAEAYKAWTSVCWPGSYYVGEWKTGEQLRFIGPDGDGTLARLTACQPYSHVIAQHIAILLKGGIEDRDSEMAKTWVGSIERYDFAEIKGITQLTVTMNIYPEWEKMFANDWPKALAKLKEICEA